MNFNLQEEFDLIIQSTNNNNKTNNDTNVNSFDNIWKQMGFLIQNYFQNFPSDNITNNTTTSFFQLTLKDFLKCFQGNISLDENNFWITQQYPTCKFTTFQQIGYEDGFYKISQNSNNINFIIFENYDSIEPKIIEHNSNKLFILPFIQSPYIVLFFLQFISNQGVSNVFNNSTSSTLLTTSTNNNINTNNNTNNNPHSLINLNDLLTKWKNEKNDSKPTIPKIAEYFQIDQKKIHTVIKQSGKSWTQYLVENGFRN